jgi:hypothetical protein
MKNIIHALVSILLVGCCQIGGLPCLNNKPSGKIIIQPDTVYMGGDGWTVSFSHNMPQGFESNPKTAGTGWYIDMDEGSDVHMILVPYHANKQHKTLTMTYRITALSGSPKFLATDPCSPNEAASFRPMLQRKGDMMVASQEFYRWWSRPTPMVADGQVHTVSFSLTYEAWTVKRPKNFKGAVFGKTDPTQFTVATQDLMAVGISFGGCYAAHGAKEVGGKAKFEMISYLIQ